MFKNFLYRVRDALVRFMVGRYGADSLYSFLFGLSIFLYALNIIFRSSVLNLISLLLIVVATFRVLSRNHAARRKENEAYLKVANKVTSFFKLTVRRFKERKNYRFRRCPHCKQVLRLPNRKGKHDVTCPKCKQEFKVTIRI